MEPVVVIAVLVAAIMHAGWNAVIKVGLDRFMSITLMGLFMGLISLVCLPFVAVPQGVTWVWIITSAVLHTGYKLFLIRAYSAGDLGQIYPLARGSAPLITAVAGFVLLGERLSPLMVAGIAVLTGGIFVMSLRGGALLEKLDRVAVGYAIGTSFFIAGYTLTDGVGARTAVSASSYAAWMFVLDGFWMVAFCMLVRGPASIRPLVAEWKTGIVIGALSLGAYWIVIWAMTRAPIAAVAALRETSVLVALVISVVVLKEKLTAWRLAAALLIVAGVILLRSG
jgi:drug/metabolite transporter (DMT)-like permease